MHHYSIEVTWSEEDAAFIATCPSFPGLSAFGDTRDEALHEAEIALEGFIEVYEEDGKPLPAPISLNAFSGRFVTRLPKTLHKRLVDLAHREGVSLNSLVQSILAGGAGELDMIHRREREFDRKVSEFLEQLHVH